MSVAAVIVGAAAALGTGLPEVADLWSAVVADFSNLGSPTALAAFTQVLLIDIVLAGDNAIVVGALAAGLPVSERRQVIAIGILAALVLRLVFALTVSWLMGVVGLVLAGGLLLLWVAWRMYRELHPMREESPGSPEIAGDEHSGLVAARSFAAAVWAVALADVSMSLDNVLAVAGAAREHPGILIVGLMLSVALMGIAANYIAACIERYHWIAWVGLCVIVYVAVKMIYDGIVDPTLGVLAFAARG